MSAKNMSKLILILVMAGFLKAHSADLSSGLAFGYNGGPGLEMRAMIGNFAQKFPFKARLGLGYTLIDNPGKSLDARRIFINNATNGKPEKQGWVWDFRMDLLYRVPWFSLPNAFIYGGPRYALFTGNFNFVDGNEDFDVKSQQWGWGLGFGSFFPMGKNFNLTVEAGVDYFFTSTLSGHDTSYSPDGEHVNDREDFTFSDADRAINQPYIGLRLLMGINYIF